VKGQLLFASSSPIIFYGLRLSVLVFFAIQKAVEVPAVIKEVTIEMILQSDFYGLTRAAGHHLDAC
jgi:hypothetical protein